MSADGYSHTVALAAEAARRKRVHVVALAGKSGGALKDIADISIVISSDSTARIQEAHFAILHMIMEVFEVLIDGRGD